MSLLCNILALGLAATPAFAQAGPGGMGGPGGMQHGPPQQSGPGRPGGQTGGGGFGGVPGQQRPSGPWVGNGKTLSPAYNYIFQNPLPIPPVAELEL